MENTENNKERLVRIKVEKNDDFIDIFRDMETHEISLCSKERCANLPNLTGQSTFELYNFLEALGDKVETPEEVESGNEQENLEV